jgi:alkylresorcinol/alkylpyrone synthase
MRRVLISEVATAWPQIRVAQAEASARIARAIGGERRVEALARSTRIETRCIAFAADRIGQLATIEERNRLYTEVAPLLAEQAVRKLRDQGASADGLVTASCTGYMVPGLDVTLAQALQLSPTTMRLPITEAGCAGGVVALARAADFLKAHSSSKQAVVAAVELCSLAFQQSSEPGNLTSTLLFGDGAAAVLLDVDDGTGRGLEVVDSSSALIPLSRDAIGFDLTDHGFAPRLSRDIAELLPGPIATSVGCLLARNGLSLPGVAFWLIHPGGPKILQVTQETLNLTEADLRWSWDSLREQGNMSSVAILDVLSRYLTDAGAPFGSGVMLAFGPGVSLELLLLHRC